jgi:hypothetical protein
MKNAPMELQHDRLTLAYESGGDAFSTLLLRIRLINRTKRSNINLHQPLFHSITFPIKPHQPTRTQPIPYYRLRG